MKKTNDTILTVNENDVSSLRDAIEMKKVLADFDLFYMDCSAAGKNNGSTYIYQYMEKDLEKDILAVCFNNRLGMEILMKKDPDNLFHLREAVKGRNRDIEEEENTSVILQPVIRQITEGDFDDPVKQDLEGRKDIVLRLLLFYSTEEMRVGSTVVSNLLGYEYVFRENASKIAKAGKKGSVITALDINVTDIQEGDEKKCRLSLSAVGFKPCSDWEINNTRSAKYQLDENGVFHRLYYGMKKRKDAVVWKKGNYPGSHVSERYLDPRTDPVLKNEYGTLLAVLKSLEVCCGKYFAQGAFEHPFAVLHVQMLTASPSGRKAAADRIRRAEYPNLGRIVVVDNTGDQEGANTKIQTVLRDQLALKIQSVWNDGSPQDVAEPGVTVTVGEESDADVCISIVHSDDYYDLNHLPDPYLMAHTAPIVQHAVLENLRDSIQEKTISSTAAKLLDECLIKRDVLQGCMHLQEWPQDGTWYFTAGFYQSPLDKDSRKKKKAEFLLAAMELHPDRTCRFASLKELKSGSRGLSMDADDLIDIEDAFRKIQRTYGQQPECAVITPSGHTYYIVEQMLRFLLPDKESYENITDRLPDPRPPKLDNKMSLRSKGTVTFDDGTTAENPMDTLFGAVRNVNVWNAEDRHAVFYTAGSTTAPQSNYPTSANACRVRAIISEDHGVVDKDDPEIQAILDCLWMPLVRATMSPSVLPCQAKYCREYLKASGEYAKTFMKRTEEDSRPIL